MYTNRLNNDLMQTPKYYQNKEASYQQKNMKTIENEPFCKQPLQSSLYNSQNNQQAKWENAVEYKESQQVYQDYSYKRKYSLNCELEELDKFGVGIRLFFQLLKYASITYWIMFLLTIPVLILFAKGQSLDQIQLSTNSLAIVSISDLPSLSVKVPPSNATDEQVNEIKQENSVILDDYINTQQSNLKTIQYYDGGCIIIFGLFFLIYKYKSNKIIAEAEFNAILPSQYTIEVTGFPSQIIDPNIIKQYFEQTFQVVVFECNFARKFYGIFSLRKELANYQSQLNQEIARQMFTGENKASKIKSLNQKIKETQFFIEEEIKYKFNNKNENHDQHPSLKAYVVLNSFQDKYFIKRQYDTFWRKLFSFFGYSLRKFKLHGKHGLKLNFYPEEPSNIIWENIETSAFNRSARNFVAFLMVLVVMLITFTIIIFANIVKPQDSEKCPQQEITRDQSSESQLYKDCFCMQQSITDIGSDQSLRTLCWDVWSKYVTTFALSIMTGLVILIVNFLLKRLIEYLNTFNRYSTVTQQSKSTLQTLFIALFINTSIITLIIQANISGFIPAVEISRPVPPIESLQKEQKQEFEVDFDRTWYLSIGTKITITMMYFIITHFLSEFAMAFYYRWRREVNTKKLCGKVLQRQANQTLQSPEFNITFYYAVVLNVIFTTMFYSSGIPILILIGAVILTMQYWVYKYRFIRICKKPPSYDAVLNDTVTKIIPFSLIFHALIGCYMYGQPLLFPFSQSEVIIEMNKISSGYEVIVNANENDPVNNRYSKSKIFLVFSIVMIALIILNYLIGLCCSIKCTNNKVTPVITTDKDFNKQQSEISKYTLATYDIRQNDNYRDIINSIDSYAQNSKQILLTNLS